MKPAPLKNFRAIAALALLAPALTISGCVMGPDYARPSVETPASYRFQTGADPASVADLPWWAVFDDPALQALVSEGLRNNQDLKVAIARIAQARATVGIIGSQAYPQVNYGAFVGAEETFSPGVNGPGTDKFSAIGGFLQATWELDLWGRIARSNEAARANLLESEEVRRGVMLSLVSDIAAAYFQLATLDRELAIAKESNKTYAETLRLFTLRFEAGRDNKLPVERAQASYEASLAQVQTIERQIGQLENAISVLVGAPPRDIVRGVALVDQKVPVTPVGAASDLLQRRPDIRASEMAMVRANAEIGVAVANQFPRIGLGALVGVTGVDMTNGSGSMGVWNIALDAAGPLFDGGRLKQVYNNRKAFWDESIAQYRQTVLVAFRETSDALVAQQTLVARRVALERQVEALRNATNLAMLRYQAGRASYFEVLEAQQELFPAEEALARTQGDQLLAVVSLYKALGGGWKLRDEEWVPQTAAAASAGG